MGKTAAVVEPMASGLLGEAQRYGHQLEPGFFLFISEHNGQRPSRSEAVHSSCIVRAFSHKTGKRTRRPLSAACRMGLMKWAPFDMPSPRGPNF